jgi:hypothetical protein
MLDEKPAAPPKRWPRGQKFTVSDAGLEAEEAYRATVGAARSSGRPALEAALAAWAGPHNLSPGDGVVLSELRGKRLGVPDLCRSLEAAGIEPAEVRAAVDRLVAAGVVQALPLASQVGA